MALSDEVAKITRRLSLHVECPIGTPLIPSSAGDGTGAGILAVRVSKSFDEPVPLATITVDHIPATVKRGQRVIIEVGYNGLRQRIFTGYVIDRAHGTESSDINCAGQLYQLARMKDLTERSVDGETVKGAIDDLFTAAGAPGAFVGVDTSEVPATFTFGTPAGYVPVLPPGDFMGMLQALMDVEGCVVAEDGYGVIKVYVSNGLPATTGVKDFTVGTEATARIIDGRSREDPDALRTRIHATGATPVEGGEPLVSTATLVGGLDLVQPPFAVASTYIDMEWSNHLVDTQAKLDSCALRVLGQYARVPRQLPLEIPGDPEIEMGDTVGVQNSYIGIDAITPWFVHGVEHLIDDSGYTTSLDLRGGDEFGGAILLNPVASFSWTVEREVFGTQVYAFIHLSAKGSRARNGSGIASYDWEGNQDAADDPAIDSQTAVEFVVRIDPTAMTGDVDNIIVTLTVTDGAGLTATVSQTIPINASSSLVTLPAVFAAMNNNFSATPDGGQNWNDDNTNATNVTTVAAMVPNPYLAGVAVFGRTDGKIYRTTDYCASDLTLVLTATDEIVDIAWDQHDAAKVWALTAICNLYVSTDYGVTWTLIVNWRTAMSLSTIIGKRVMVQEDGYVWVYGGTGVSSNGRPFIGRFKNGESPFGFASAFGGELATDLGSGSTNLAIVDAANKGDGGGLVIILENYTAYNSGVRPIYHVPDPFVPTGWKRATGLDAGVTGAGKYVVPDSLPGYFHAAFADRDIWHTTNGIAWTVTADAMPAGVTPNRAIWLREDAEGLRTTGTYLIAAENAGSTLGIYKSYDSLLSVAAFRPATGFATWPASAKGKDLAVGGAGGGTLPRIAVVHDTSGATTWDISYPQSAGVAIWTNVALPAAQTHERPRPYCITKDLWFVANVGGFPNPTSQSFLSECNREMSRSQDGGATWGSIAVGDETATTERAPSGDEINHFARIARDAGGRLWAVRMRGSTTAHPVRSQVMYSDDNGTAWTSSTTLSVASSARPPYALLADTVNQNRIVLVSAVRTGDEGVVIHYTLDRGASWATNAPTVASGNNFAHTQNGNSSRHLLLPSGRLVIANRRDNGDHMKIYTSDNWGAVWTLRYTDAEVDEDNMLILTQGQWRNFGQHLVGLRVPVFSGAAGTVAVMNSIDGGETWTIRDVDDPPNTVLGNDWDAIYDELTDTIVAQNGSRMASPSRIVQLRQATNGGTTWEDVTGNLPFTNGAMHWEGIALIPR